MVGRDRVSSRFHSGGPSREPMRRLRPCVESETRRSHTTRNGIRDSFRHRISYHHSHVIHTTGIYGQVITPACSLVSSRCRGTPSDPFTFISFHSLRLAMSGMSLIESTLLMFSSKVLQPTLATGLLWLCSQDNGMMAGEAWRQLAPQASFDEQPLTKHSIHIFSSAGP